MNVRRGQLRLLFLLWRFWRRYPSWRFCQVVVNVSNRNDPFYMEDDAFVQKLKEWNL